MVFSECFLKVGDSVQISVFLWADMFIGRDVLYQDCHSSLQTVLRCPTRRIVSGDTRYDPRTLLDALAVRLADGMNAFVLMLYHVLSSITVWY